MYLKITIAAVESLEEGYIAQARVEEERQKREKEAGNA